MSSSIFATWLSPFVIQGLSVSLNCYFIFTQISIFYSVDPERMPLSAASDLGLHYLQGHDLIARNS